MPCDTLTSSMEVSGRMTGALTQTDRMAAATFCRAFDFTQSAPAPSNAITDEFGNAMTDENGNPITD